MWKRLYVRSNSHLNKIEKNRLFAIFIVSVNKSEKKIEYNEIFASKSSNTIIHFYLIRIDVIFSFLWTLTVKLNYN